MSETVHLVCAHCAGVNRVPTARLGENARCGSCHQEVLSDHPLELTSGSFRKHVQHDDLPLAVDFWAPWCGPCQMMAPQFAAAAKELRSEARLVKVNTDAEPGIAGEFGIRSIPTLILFKGGREIARQSGAMGTADIARWIRARAVDA
jgi:thioredoxin 2